MTAHSILPPSGAKAWRQCPAWVSMNHHYPKPDTPETLEGNAAHWVAWELLAGRQVCEGQICPNNIVVTEEMIEGGELMVETIRLRIPPDAKIYVERPVSCATINAHCWGTPDVWAFFGDTLEIIDYKFGHRFVDEFENDQCVTYAAGIIDQIAEQLQIGAGVLDQQLKVNITIVQPRCFYKGASVRTWSTIGSDLRPQINKLYAAAELALMPNPVAITNIECLDCPGRHVCPALQKSAYSDAEFAVQSTPVELSPAAASLELKMLERALDRLQSRVDGLKEVVTGHIRAGNFVPWHRVEQGYGRQRWNMTNDEVIILGQLMGVDLSKPGVKTPKQALQSGVDAAVITEYSSTPMGSLKLVPDNPADARRVFGKSHQE